MRDLTVLVVCALILLGCGDGAGSDGEADGGDVSLDGGADVADGTQSDGGDADTTDAAASDTLDGSELPDGALLFMEPHADGNAFACLHCHALEEPAADGLRRPGHSVGDAANRPSFKNGRLSTLLDAVNVCRADWMAAPAFEEDDPRWTALEAYLTETAADTPAEALTISQVLPPDDLTGGDVEQGRATFNGTCVACHGMNAIGTHAGPPLVGEFLNAEYVASRVRTSGPADSVYDGLTGGRMPFWADDRLSDDELRDVIAFVLQNDPAMDPGPGMDDDPDRRVCGAEHEDVGTVAQFETFYHGVTGTVTIVDDCTFALTGFGFDATGVNVQFYGGLGGNYGGGFSMSDDIRRAEPYVDDSFMLQLPEGTTLDDLDGISVWCVPIGINFGDATW